MGNTDELDTACLELPESVRAAMLDGLQGGKKNAKLIEDDLFGKGGFAFHVSDVVGIDDVLTVLGGVVSTGDLGSATVALFKIWMKLREIRIDLTGEEVRVLRSIKRGATTTADIANDLGVAVDDAIRIVGELKQKSPLNTVPIITESNGHFATTF